MSPRVNRRRPPSAKPAGAVRGVDQVQSWPDGDWVVRPVTGASSTKTYRCPGCDQEIVPTTPHVVAWPAGGGGSAGGSGGSGGPEDRRHWHQPCWAAHDRRGVKVQRSRNAPRYG